MISFYPGPSRVYDEIPAWIKAAHQKGILSMNHRSEEFIALSKETIVTLKKKLSIPEEFLVLYHSSATECWEVIAQSLVKTKSIHIYNGAFGEKWFQYTQKIKPAATSVVFDRRHLLDSKDLVFNDGEMICVTQNETSNGTQVGNTLISNIKTNNPGHLIAVDATSSMAGIHLDFRNGDIWFASVQKCFGLPAGLSLMICSPRAIAQIETLRENRHYNSLVFMKEMMMKWQTPYTPNVLAIYLLNCVVKKIKKISDTDVVLRKRQKEWVKFFSKSKTMQLLIDNPEVQSSTVITVTGSPELITLVKAAARKKGLLLGEGYGDLKKDTFRIANFPALKTKEIQKLRDFLKKYLKR